MTLYLCIAAYLAVAFLMYGIVCGLEWSEFGYWSGWGRSDTLWCVVCVLLLPIGIGHVIMRGCSVWRGGLDRMPFRPRWYFRSRKPARPVCAYAPPEGTVARKMRDLSLGAPIVRDENANAKMRKLKVDVLGWALESISHSAKFGVRYAVFNDDPGCPEAWAGCEYLKN